MILTIDGTHRVAPIRQGGFHSQSGETWSNYAVYAMADIARVFRGHSIQRIIDDTFTWGCNGAGQSYARRPIIRCSRQYVFVCQAGGLDI